MESLTLSRLLAPAQSDCMNSNLKVKADVMNNKPIVKVIKKAGLKNLKIKIPTPAATGPIKWSKAVRSWIVDFQERDRTEYLPAFDSLFKDALHLIKKQSDSSLERKDMAIVDVLEIKDERAAPERAKIEAYASKSGEPSSAAPRLVRKGRHLDVDEILARSLPKTLSQSSFVEP